MDHLTTLVTRQVLEVLCRSCAESGEQNGTIKPAIGHIPYREKLSDDSDFKSTVMYKQSYFYAHIIALTGSDCDEQNMPAKNGTTVMTSVIGHIAPGSRKTLKHCFNQGVVKH